MKKLISRIAEYPRLLALFLGLLAVRALPPFFCFPILFVSFGGLLLLINAASSKRKAFGIGYWFGFTYFACNMSWIGNALLVDALRFGWLYPITLLAAGAFFGLFAAVPAALSLCFKNIYARWFSFSAFWVVLEWIRSFIFTGFPWNLLGSVLAFSDETVQLASVVGTYGLSLLTVMLTSAPALCFPAPSARKTAFVLSSVAVAAALIWSYGVWRLKHMPEEKSDTMVRIVQPAIPQTMKWKKEELENNFREYIRLSRLPGLEQIDFVIWGETASPFPLDFEPRKLREIMQAVPSGGYLLTGLVRYELDGETFAPVNSMFVINTQGKIVDFYDKSHLVPFGEYIPFRRWLPDWIRPITNVVANFLPGTGPKVIKTEGQPSFGALICYEIIFPSQIVDADNRPQWLVNLTNDGWYGVSQGPYQHLVTARMRAVEEGLSIVRAANTGISAIISPYGQITAFLPLNQKGIIDAELPAPTSLSTVYGHWGNLLPLTLCLLNIIFAFLLHRKDI